MFGSVHGLSSHTLLQFCKQAEGGTAKRHHHGKPAHLPSCILSHSRQPRLFPPSFPPCFPQEGIDAIGDVIYHVETFDTTSIRASTPMFLMSRKIKALGVKMVLSGEGSDEVFGGYLYFHKAPSKVRGLRAWGMQACSTISTRRGVLLRRVARCAQQGWCHGTCRACEHMSGVLASGSGKMIPTPSHVGACGNEPCH